MNYRQTLPSTASVAHQEIDGRLNAPAAEKNAASIVALTISNAPHFGKALEIASGTGQHIVQLATLLPNLIWQPSDVDENRIKSIKAWSQHKNLMNLKVPCFLDATEAGWSENYSNFDFLLLVNLLHLISDEETKILIAEISKSLAPNGRALIYGPFMRDGALTSAGDKEFHQSLINADAYIGYKNDTDILRMFDEFGLINLGMESMPANNLAFIFEKL